MIPGKVCSLNPESWALESWALESWALESRIQLNLTKDWNPESKFHRSGLESSTWNPINPRRGIQNPGLSWIPLHGVHINLYAFLNGSSF